MLGLRSLPDTLPGRSETIELWPFSQGEIDGTADRFIDAVFAEGEDLHHASAVPRADYAERIVRGGFPEAVARPAARRRERFLDSYAADLIARDVRQLSEIGQAPEMRTLMRRLAASSGQLLGANALSRELAGLNACLGSQGWPGRPGKSGQEGVRIQVAISAVARFAVSKVWI